MHNEPINIQEENRFLGVFGERTFRIAATLGFIGLAAAVFLAFGGEDGRYRFFHSYLVSFAYFLSLALGALFFVMLQHVVKAGWSVVLRRIAEGVAATLPLMALLVIPVLVGMHELYAWTDAEEVAHSPLLQGKTPYLNVPFFAIRVAVYFIAWLIISQFFFKTSVRQDASGDVELTKRMQRASGPSIVVYALTVTFAAFDLLMSLEPNWFSTIFGVYYFSGGVVGFFALLAVFVVAIQQSGRLTHAITVEHFQDVGKLIFAFVVFWAYIAFSQYMLIWYANIPEETTWFLTRQNGDWATISLVLLFGHFVIPFLWLISRYPKRKAATLVPAALWVLVMHWVDIYWLVMPGSELGKTGHVPFHPMDAACFVGIGGLFVAAMAYRLRDRSLVPERDPRLPESLTFENV